MITYAECEPKTAVYQCRLHNKRSAPSKHLGEYQHRLAELRFFFHFQGRLDGVCAFFCAQIRVGSAHTLLLIAVGPAMLSYQNARVFNEW